MREVVQIHYGSEGAQLGHEYWRLVSCEHGLSADTGQLRCGSLDQVERMPAMFLQERGRYWARGIIAGGHVRRSGLLRPDCHVPANIPIVMEALRRELERCDHAQSVQLCGEVTHDMAMLSQHIADSAKK